MSKHLDHWQQAKARGEKRSLITAYDFPFAQLAATAGIDGVLVGDSLGMVVQGRHDTLSVTLEHMCYHTEMVARGAGNCLVFADLPLGTYEASPSQAWGSAVQLLQAGADVIKWEGGAEMAETVAFCAARGLNVCAHLGLTPQRMRQWGRFQRQGTDSASARKLLDDARALATAGARFLLLEAVPAGLAAEITASVSVPVIGIGAGAEVDAQVLVLHDVLGLGEGMPPFARAFVDGRAFLAQGLENYAKAVRQGQFPKARSDRS